MVQDSSNGSGPDTRNWRERLGVAAQELPKLTDEFRDEPPAAAPEQRSSPAAPQQVVTPAPMAPRVPRKAADAGTPASAPSPAVDRAPGGAYRATPKVPDNAMQDALAEKLRAQRAAAERLAEQRVLAARQKAEARPISPPASARPAAAPPSRTTLPPPSAARPSPPAGSGAKPKFSFADEGRGAGLTPPRPALGTERGQPAFLRPSTQGAAGSSLRNLPSYRSAEASSGAVQRAPGTGFSSTRLSARRSSTSDLYARRTESRESAGDDLADNVPSRVTRASPPTRDDLDQVFEDEAPQRSRATAVDYQSAYQQGDEFFAEEPRRSSGPWLLLLALLVAAMATGAVVWFYSDAVRNLATGVSGTVTGSGSGTVPVVEAPAEPTKVTPEAAAPGDAAAPATQKKQIYDRIVGEQEVIGGQVQPTEEPPLAPGDVPAAQEVPQPAPAAGAGQIPAPDAANQSTGQGLPEVEPPPPLPLPPASGQEGNLAPGAGAKVAAASAPPQPGATPPPTPAATAETQPTPTALLPPPETATDGAALVSEGASTAVVAAQTAEVAASPSASDVQTNSTTPATPDPAPVPSPKKKPTAKKKSNQQDFDNLGSSPVVLVPPAQPPAADVPAASQTPATQPAAPAPAKKKTIFNIFGNSEQTAPEPETQVAAIEKPAPPKAETQGAGGFVVQLASYRSEAEAAKEYARLSKAYPALVGPLQRQIRQTSVAGGTRYQLGLGPVASRGEATRVCSELIAGGESDCVVRNP